MLHRSTHDSHLNPSVPMFVENVPKLQKSPSQKWFLKQWWQSAGFSPLQKPIHLVERWLLSYKRAILLVRVLMWALPTVLLPTATVWRQHSIGCWVVRAERNNLKWVINVRLHINKYYLCVPLLAIFIFNTSNAQEYSLSVYNYYGSQIVTPNLTVT